MASTPLRRKSLRPQFLEQEELPINDDDAELRRRRSELQLNNSGLERRQSFTFNSLSQLSKAQIDEQLAMCNKLNMENKINTKNAFSLNIIDLLSYVTSTHTSTLQVASSSLDASSKVYGFRVDSVHSEVLKMVGALDSKDRKSEENEPSLDKTENTENEEPQVKRRRVKRNSAILTTAEALSGKTEKHSLHSLVSQDGDPQTSNKMNQAVSMSQADSWQKLQSSDFLVLDIAPEKKQETEKDPILDGKLVPTVDAVEMLDIAPVLKFVNWSVHNEEQNNDSFMNISSVDDNNDVRFNMDDDLPDPTPFPATQEVEAHNSFVNRNNRKSMIPENLENFDDLIGTSILNQSLEYHHAPKKDIIQFSVPIFWNIKRASAPASENKLQAEASRKAKKKEFTLDFSTANDDPENDPFEQGSRTKLSQKTLTGWNEEDWHQYLSCADEEIEDKFSYFFANRKFSLFRRVGGDIERNVRNIVPEHEEPELGMEHDVDFHERDDSDRQDNDGDNLVETDNQLPVIPEEEQPTGFGYTQGGLVGDNLITAPDYVAELNIPYSKKAKKVDIRQFKRAMWKIIDSETADEKETTFKQIYETLPTELSKSNADALSAPLAFVTILHIANEKVLELITVPDKSDILVKKDTRKESN